LIARVEMRKIDKTKKKKFILLMWEAADAQHPGLKAHPFPPYTIQISKHDYQS